MNFNVCLYEKTEQLIPHKQPPDYKVTVCGQRRNLKKDTTYNSFSTSITQKDIVWQPSKFTEIPFKYSKTKLHYITIIITNC